MGVNDPSDLRALDKILGAEVGDRAVVAAYVGSVSPERVKQSPDDDEAVDTRLKDVFSEVVFSAEKLGRPVQLLALPGDDAAGVLLQAAQCLAASELWLGSSPEVSDQKSALQRRWHAIALPGQTLRVVLVNGSAQEPVPWVLELEDRTAAKV